LFHRLNNARHHGVGHLEFVPTCISYHAWCPRYIPMFYLVLWKDERARLAPTGGSLFLSQHCICILLFVSVTILKLMIPRKLESEKNHVIIVCGHEPWTSNILQYANPVDIEPCLFMIIKKNILIPINYDI